MKPVMPHVLVFEHNQVKICKLLSFFRLVMPQSPCNSLHPTCSLASFHPPISLLSYRLQSCLLLREAFPGHPVNTKFFSGFSLSSLLFLVTRLQDRVCILVPCLHPPECKLRDNWNSSYSCLYPRHLAHCSAQVDA